MELKEQQVKTLNKIFDKNRTKDDKETLQQKMKITWRKGRMRSMPRKTDENIEQDIWKEQNERGQEMSQRKFKKERWKSKNKTQKDQERL